MRIPSLCPIALQLLAAIFAPPPIARSLNVVVCFLHRSVTAAASRIAAFQHAHISHRPGRIRSACSRVIASINGIVSIGVLFWRQIISRCFGPDVLPLICVLWDHARHRQP
jgi:hypothetical protein